VVRSVSQKKPLVKSYKSNSSLLTHQRSLLLFYSAIKTNATKKQYEKYLNEFLSHFIIKNFDKLTQIPPKKLQEMIEDFIMYDKSQNKSASYISGKIFALKLFFSMNDVILNWDKIKKMIPERNKPSGDKAYTTEQIQILLKNTANLEYKALICFKEGFRIKPPPTEVIITDDPYGWEYLEDFNKEGSQFR